MSLLMPLFIIFMSIKVKSQDIIHINKQDKSSALKGHGNALIFAEFVNQTTKTWKTKLFFGWSLILAGFEFVEKARKENM